MNMKKTVMALVLLCQVMMACGQQKAKQTAPQGGDDFATKMENTIAQYNALESEAEQLLKGEENDETFDRLVALGLQHTFHYSFGIILPVKGTDRPAAQHARGNTPVEDSGQVYTEAHV